MSTPPPDTDPAAAARASRCAEASQAEIHNGYWFWGVVMTVILLVELAGALKDWLKRHDLVAIPWTTISGMVGHLEELWSTSAVLVVALIAPVAFFALGPPKHGRLSRLGRLDLRAAPAKKPLKVYNAWVALGFCAIAGVVAVSIFSDDFVRAYVIYGALFFFGIIVPSLLLLVLRREVGFTSLFCTIWQLRRRDDWKANAVTVALVAGLGILVIHLAFYPWPDITKEPVVYAGHTAREARTEAAAVIHRRHQGTALIYSTQTRGIVGGKNAWLVYFVYGNGADSGCVVTISNSPPEWTRQCGT